MKIRIRRVISGINEGPFCWPLCDGSLELSWRAWIGIEIDAKGTLADNLDKKVLEWFNGKCLSNEFSEDF